MSSPEAAMIDVAQPTFCMYQPVPGEVLKAACLECGHAVALHIGVEHCPVCELVERNRQARAAIRDGGVHVEVTGIDKRTLEETVRHVLERDQLRDSARYRRYR